MTFDFTGSSVQSAVWGATCARIEFTLRNAANDCYWQVIWLGLDPDFEFEKLDLAAEFDSIFQRKD